MLQHKRGQSRRQDIYPKIHFHLIALRPLSVCRLFILTFLTSQTLRLEVSLKFHSSDSDASNLAQLQSQVLKSQPAEKSCDRTSLCLNFTRMLCEPMSPTHHALPPDGRWCRSPCSSHRVASARINTPISPKAKLSLLLKVYLPLSVPACRLLSTCTLLWPSTQPTQPSLTPNSSTPVSGWLWSGALRKKSLLVQLGSAQLSAPQFSLFSYTRPALHLCE